MKHFNKLTRFFIVPVVLFITANILNAFEIKGKIIDQKDGLPIENANIFIAGTRMGTTSDKNGEFTIENVEPGIFTITISHIGYKVIKRNLSVNDQNISATFSAVPSVLKGQQIIVSAMRAKERETPIAFTDITAKDVKNKYWAQEIPLLLDEVPGVYSYSNTGSGLGYSEIKIRGFDATRVGVTINDVPLNDPIDHVTYFYDLPDISANVQDIQVQRGVGNSLYGTGSFAGSVNLRTALPGNERFITYAGGTGSYNTRKHTFSIGSGLIDNTYSFYGRYSKVNTDGYRDFSWVDSWSYFFSASRYDEHLTTTVNLFGGPMRTHFAWEGITREEMQNNRKLNYDDYKNAADNFNQPHYQLINEWTPTDNLKFTSTLFHVKGDGYYEQLKTGRKLTEYNMPEFEENGVPVKSADLVRQKWVDKSQYGWIPRFEVDKGKNQFSAGGEISLFRSHHWGEVVWGSNLPPDVQPGHEYYQYNLDKNSISVYINDLLELKPGLYLKTGLLYQHIAENFDQKKMGAFYGHKYDLNYNFLTPRIGLNYNLNPAVNVFGNFSMAKREPKDADIYDADDPSIMPSFRTIDPDKGIYKDPYVKEETLYDFETGLGYHADNLTIKLNAFWMDFDNEIVATGGITDDGYPVYGNAQKSVHRGMELDLKLTLPMAVDLAANATYSDNYFVDYTEYFWNADWTGSVNYNRNGNKIGNFPALLGNCRLAKNFGPVYMSAHFRYIDRIYLDNSQQKELSIDPYKVVNLSARINLPQWFGPLKLSASLFINNVLNEKYELSGYTYDNVGYYLPAAGRNYFVSLQTQL